ncbi:MAG TPA: hypothetical protein P5572_00420 [Phycisphaerae bacterium]|nr:hypothetical protein [Phycisphaerales bacterium]HRX83462.1 hypothetical protein [Phycisphaerae bacterium]
MLKRMWEFLTDVLRGDLVYFRTGQRIWLTEHGFTFRRQTRGSFLEHGKRVDCQGIMFTRILWTRVERIEAFHTDAVPPFEPELSFHVQDASQPIAVNRTARGFRSLRRALSARFPGIPQNWHRTIRGHPSDVRVILYASTGEAATTGGCAEELGTP